MNITLITSHSAVKLRLVGHVHYINMKKKQFQNKLYFIHFQQEKDNLYFKHLEQTKDRNISKFLWQATDILKQPK